MFKWEILWLMLVLFVSLQLKNGGVAKAKGEGVQGDVNLSVVIPLVQVGNSDWLMYIFQSFHWFIPWVSLNFSERPQGWSS